MSEAKLYYVDAKCKMHGLGLEKRLNELSWNKGMVN